MARIELLLEEPSMRAVLEVILPKIVPSGWILDENYFLRPHEGKQDLQQSIPRKMRVFSAYHEPAGIVIVQDQDSHDCKLLKQKLQDSCINATLIPCPFLIRIVCHELEGWYLGDFDALIKAYPDMEKKLASLRNKAKYRNPDALSNAAQELKKIIPQFQKITGAQQIAPHLNIDQNNSESFNQFVRGIKSFFATIT